MVAWPGVAVRPSENYLANSWGGRNSFVHMYVVWYHAPYTYQYYYHTILSLSLSLYIIEREREVCYNTIQTNRLASHRTCEIHTKQLLLYFVW